MKLAKENGMEDFTEESAKAYFETVHKSGEISDEELENAVGGCKTGDGRRVVSRGLLCPHPKRYYGWECKVCHQNRINCSCGRPNTTEVEDAFGVTGNFNKIGACDCCVHCTYEGGKWYCNDARTNLI